METAEKRFDVRELVDKLEQVLLRIILAISPLDVSLLLGSIRGSCMTANLIKDKDVIILLGSTGVGKSTLMHFLAGSKMRVTDVDGIPHLEPEEVVSGLEDVKFSCSSRSVTTGIHAITMNMSGETYIVCDTAGFDDTRAVEYDIASGIVMTNAIRSLSHRSGNHSYETFESKEESHTSYYQTYSLVQKLCWLCVLFVQHDI